MTVSEQYPIIDPHHHYWDPVLNNHPWLSGPEPIKFRYGDYSALRNKPFLPADYAAISASWNVVATATMEGEWDPADPVGEVEWLSGLREEQGVPAAHAAQAWLDSGDLEATLETISAFDFVRSVRHKPIASVSPASGTQGGMCDSAFRSGFSLLSKYALHFELQTPWWHLHEARHLIARDERTLVILNHTGLPSDRSAEGLAGWLLAMKEFAALPQTCVKISGLGIVGQRWSLASNRDIIRYTIDLFGPERCMFASNFPVDGLIGDFDTIYNGYWDIAASYSEAERHALFAGTAARVYSIDIL